MRVIRSPSKQCLERSFVLAKAQSTLLEIGDALTDRYIEPNQHSCLWNRFLRQPAVNTLNDPGRLCCRLPDHLNGELLFAKDVVAARLPMYAVEIDGLNSKSFSQPYRQPAFA